MPGMAGEIGSRSHALQTNPWQPVPVHRHGVNRCKQGGVSNQNVRSGYPKPGGTPLQHRLATAANDGPKMAKAANPFRLAAFIDGGPDWD